MIGKVVEKSSKLFSLKCEIQYKKNKDKNRRKIKKMKGM
jgi:hypothetical protein